MNQQNIIAKIEDIIKDQLSLDSLDKKKEYLQALGADSLDFLEIVMRVEEEFDIHISDDEFEAIETIDELIACVNRKLHL